MDGYLRKQLRILSDAVRDDFDGWIIVDGEIEGSGKSVLAQQVGRCLDPTLNLDRIVFSPDQFSSAVMKANPRECIIWDEAGEGTSSTSVMSKLNRTLKVMAEKIRQKNLFIILVRPSFFDFSKYYAIHRTWFLLSVKLSFDPKYEKIRRGVFHFYSRNRKKQLYLRGRKEMNYNAAKANFYGRFVNSYAVDKEAYKKKKALIEEQSSKDN